ncbi:MAG: hypothetical protein A2X93_09740 [Deltaproteobacteria bacterium GWC2_56_8]|nr:MAG: hypothetical protein A2X99_03835 [Deltaproteobacteria bacterium GWB2_55_19]OGP32737.1 MAG: hypothetical protein A2X93_09740 [Deltaproteobacteria bacterium GWC2_56_8]HAO94005.1 hypothetical protein [Deltaproteobacteria bacterium]
MYLNPKGFFNDRHTRGSWAALFGIIEGPTPSHFNGAASIIEQKGAVVKRFKARKARFQGGRGARTVS